MKRRNSNLILLGAFWLAVGCGYTCAAEKPGADETRAGRIVHVWDGCTMWLTILDQRVGAPNREIPGPAAQFSKRILEEMIDEEAAALRRRGVKSSSRPTSWTSCRRLAHLGIDIDPAWKLDGRPVGLKQD
jgi:hypothetical protein